MFSGALWLSLKTAMRVFLYSPVSDAGLVGCSSILIQPIGRMWLCLLILDLRGSVGVGFLGAGIGFFSIRSPCTRNKEPLSAWSSVLTFWRILWHKDRTSSSLQISFTWKHNVYHHTKFDCSTLIVSYMKGNVQEIGKTKRIKLKSMNWLAKLLEKKSFVPLFFLEWFIAFTNETETNK